VYRKSLGRTYVSIGTGYLLGSRTPGTVAEITPSILSTMVGDYNELLSQVIVGGGVVSRRWSQESRKLEKLKFRLAQGQVALALEERYIT
jgi:hypothetical protein